MNKVEDETSRLAMELETTKVRHETERRNAEKESRLLQKEQEESLNSVIDKLRLELNDAENRISRLTLDVHTTKLEMEDETEKRKTLEKENSNLQRILEENAASNTDKLRLELNDAENRISRLTLDVHTTKLELEDETDKRKTLEKENSNLLRILEENATSNTDKLRLELLQQLKKLNATIHSKNKTIQELHEDASNLKTEKDSLICDLKDTKNRLKEQDKEKKKFQKELNILRAEKRSLEGVVNVTKNRVDDYKNRITTLSKDKTKLEPKNETAKQKAAEKGNIDLQRKLECSKSEIESLKLELKDAEKRISRLTMEVQKTELELRAEKQKRIINEQYSNLSQNELEEHLIPGAETQLDLNDAENRISRLTLDLHTTTLELEDETEKRKTVEKENSNLQRKLEENVTSDTDKLRLELLHQLRKLNAIIDSKEKMIRKLHDEVNSIKTERDSVICDLKDTENKLKEQEKEKQKLQKEANILKAEKHSLNGVVNVTRSQVKDLQNTIARLKPEKEKAQLELKHETAKRIAAEKEHSDLQRKLGHAKSDLNSLKSKIARLMPEKEKTQLELKNETAKRIAAEKQRSDLQRRLECAKSDIDDLKSILEEEKQRNREEPTLCAICIDKERDALLYPCCHTCCYDCGKTLFERKQRCHMCRGPISDLSKIYLT